MYISRPSAESIIANRAERDIKTAVKVYSERTTETAILDDISPDFIRRLAVDSTNAKKDLREFLSRSPRWIPELDALKIPGELPAEINSERVDLIAGEILFPALVATSDSSAARDIQYLKEFVVNNETSDDMIASLSRIDAKAYKPGRKKSRIFRDCCKALGIADESAGSDFSKNFAKLSDLLNVHPKKFNLYVSINPAHFLTMSNPKCDTRGSTLTSCHSLNSTEYPYNCGCSGYARDTVTMIAFTVADDDDPETFFNRKTTRQIYAYKPGNGVLLQSRMYNTAGGTYGAAKETAVYRAMIEKEIAALENVPDKWKIKESYKHYQDYAIADENFGGYTDWTYSSMDGKICILDAFAETAECLTIGAAGLCVVCGDETSEGMYCDCHRENRETCDDCGDYEDEDNMYFVYERDRGYREERHVCEWCFSRHYSRCGRCDEYYNNDDMTRVQGGDYVCSDCLSEYYVDCEDCGEWIDFEDSVRVVDEDGDERYICEDCRIGGYTWCDECEQYRPDEMFTNSRGVCDECTAKLKETEDENENESAA